MGGRDVELLGAVRQLVSPELVRARLDEIGTKRYGAVATSSPN
jgi:hypothetical protein